MSRVANTHPCLFGDCIIVGVFAQKKLRVDSLFVDKHTPPAASRQQPYFERVYSSPNASFKRRTRMLPLDVGAGGEVFRGCVPILRFVGSTGWQKCVCCVCVLRGQTLL